MNANTSTDLRTRLSEDTYRRCMDVALCFLKQNTSIRNRELREVTGIGYDQAVTFFMLRQPGTSKNTQPLVVPFDPENSFLYRKLVDRFPAFGEQMPLAKPPLADHGKALVRQWILEGATDR